MTEEEYNNLPKDAKAVLDTFDESGDHYAECDRITKELAVIGYESDYDLSGTIIYVKKA